MKRKTGKRNFENRTPRAALPQQRIEQKWFFLPRRRRGIAFGIEAGFRGNILRRSRTTRRTGSGGHFRSSSGRRRQRAGRRGGHRLDRRAGRQFGSSGAPASRQAEAGDDGRGKRKSDTDTREGQGMLHGRSSDAGNIADQAAAAILCRQRLAGAFTPCLF